MSPGIKLEIRNTAYRSTGSEGKADNFFDPFDFRLSTFDSD